MELLRLPPGRLRGPGAAAPGREGDGARATTKASSTATTRTRSTSATWPAPTGSRAAASWPRCSRSTAGSCERSAHDPGHGQRRARLTAAAAGAAGGGRAPGAAGRRGHARRVGRALPVRPLPAGAAGIAPGLPGGIAGGGRAGARRCGVPAVLGRGGRDRGRRRALRRSGAGVAPGRDRARQRQVGDGASGGTVGHPPAAHDRGRRCDRLPGGGRRAGLPGPRRLHEAARGEGLARLPGAVGRRRPARAAAGRDGRAPCCRCPSRMPSRSWTAARGSPRCW